MDRQQVPDPPQMPNDIDLSQREYEVLYYIASGLSMHDLADRMGIAYQTAHTYRLRMKEKVGVKTDVDIVMFALRKGIVDYTVDENKDHFGEKEIWCVTCGKRFKLDEVPENTSACPECGSEGVPCSSKVDLKLDVNWQELRILTMWAENWAHKCDSEDPDSDMVRTVQSIARRLMIQTAYEDLGSLTFSGEVKELADYIAKNKDVFGVITGDTVAERKKAIVKGDGAIGKGRHPITDDEAIEYNDTVVRIVQIFIETYGLDTTPNQILDDSYGYFMDDLLMKAELKPDQLDVFIDYCKKHRGLDLEYDHAEHNMMTASDWFKTPVLIKIVNDRSK